MEPAAELVALHLEWCRFREADTAFQKLVGEHREFSAVARLGQRLLRLDLERVDLADHGHLASAVPSDLASRVGGLQFPRRPDSIDRGPLADFGPLVSLMLEVFAIRWRRRESLHVLALIHLIGEYAGHMAWEPVLGHSLDPPMLADDVSGRASLWGQVGDDRCGHRRSQQHLASEVSELEMMRSEARWVEFLHEEYSRVGEMMTVCALRGSMRAFDRRVRGCSAHCSVWVRHSEADRDALERRARLAALLGASPLIQMRHSAPVGHFFGVPDLEEIAQEWGRFAHEARKRLGHDLSVGGGVDDMPQNLCLLISALRGEPTQQSSLVADVVSHLRSLLDASTRTVET